jgi:homoserine dehydrogenase
LDNAPPISIGLMGLGVVGSSVVQALEEQRDIISARLGRVLNIKAVLVREKDQIRSIKPKGSVITDNPRELLEDPTIQIIVELIGGENPAYDYIQTAIKRGKHVVTGNKEVLAKHGPLLMALARENRCALRFEASVGGGIPIIGPLQRDLLANRFSSVRAIINGTTNYILSRMAEDGLEFSAALQQAKELGYAESNPSNDLDGVDAAFKLAILCSLAFHSNVYASDVYYEGINNLAAADFQYASDLGYAIKLLAIGRQSDGALQMRVHPSFIPTEHPLARVKGVFNAVELQGDLIDQVMFYGRGAGGAPTASAVVSDILDIAGNIAVKTEPVLPPQLNKTAVVRSMGELEIQYYIRLWVKDKPGVMAQITKVIGDSDVSIAAVIQKAVIEPEQLAEVVVTTHLAKEVSIQQALFQLSQLESVQEVSNMVRIES